tara:strand:+ start:5563 stop:6318 length:756 start_codon:yes stop_codon:yes gene_type:complete
MVNPVPKQYKILLIGDSCYDEYHSGSVSRISPEAPVPIFDMKSTVIKKGMAYNVYNNLVNLGVKVHIITEYSERKHRYIDSKTGQQLLRVDEKIKKQFVDTAEETMNGYDAVVLSDYNKGFIQDYEIKKIRSKFGGPIFVDTKKKNLSQFDGCFVKINQYEYEQAESLTDELIVTYGSKKVEYKNRSYIPPKVETHDVCGAGDTFLASLIFKYLEEYDMDQAIKFAMQAAAITVQHIGVYAPTLKEISNEA